MEKQKQKNKDIIQSYILTVAKYESNIYVKRILTHIVNANQNYLEGQKLGGTIINIEEDLFKNREYTLDTKELLQDENDKNHKRVYDAFDYLQSKFFAYEDSEIRFRVPFVTAVYAKKRSGTIRFCISELVHRAFTDYTKGYRKYELQISLSLTSVYSIRLYELLSGQTNPLIKTIDDLKEMFNVQEKYKETKDFLKRIIEPAKQELDEKSPYSFTYTPLKTGKKITALKFYPVYNPKNRDTELEATALKKRISPSWDLTDPVRQYLKHQFDFTTAELKTHIELFKMAQSKIDDMMVFLSKVKARANRANNPKGYLINALRKELKQRPA